MAPYTELLNHQPGAGHIQWMNNSVTSRVCACVCCLRPRALSHACAQVASGIFTVVSDRDYAKGDQVSVLRAQREGGAGEQREGQRKRERERERESTRIRRYIYHTATPSATCSCCSIMALSSMATRPPAPVPPSFKRVFPPPRLSERALARLCVCVYACMSACMHVLTHTILSVRLFPSFCLCLTKCVFASNTRSYSRTQRK